MTLVRWSGQTPCSGGRLYSQHWLSVPAQSLRQTELSPLILIRDYPITYIYCMLIPPQAFSVHIYIHIVTPLMYSVHTNYIYILRQIHAETTRYNCCKCTAACTHTHTHTQYTQVGMQSKTCTQTQHTCSLQIHTSEAPTPVRQCKFWIVLQGNQVSEIHANKGHKTEQLVRHFCLFLHCS